MPGNKYSSELLLQGKFEFDQSSLSTAAQFTQELVNTIEKPLQEMTQRIVNNLFGRQGLGQGFQGGLVNQYGQPISSAPQGGGLPPISGGPTPPPPGGGGGQQPPGMPPVSATTKAFLDQFQQSGDLIAGLTSRMSGGQYGLNYGPYAEGNVARMIQQASRAGVNLQLSEEQRETMRGAAGAMRGDLAKVLELSIDEQKQFMEEIKKLSEKTQDLQKTMAEATDAEQKKQAGADLLATQKMLEDKQRAAQDAAEKTGAQISRTRGLIEAAEAPDEADAMEKAAKRAVMTRGVIAGIGAAGAFITGAARLPGELRAEEAARYGMSGMAGRMLAQGDISGLAALQNIGGQEAVRQRAGIETFGQGVGGILSSTAIGSVGGGALAAILAAMGTGAAGGAAAGGGIASLPLALIGGLGGLAYGTYNYYTNSERMQQQNMQAQVAAEREKYAEYYGAMDQSRGRAMMSFQTAQRLGSRGVESFLYGGASTRQMQDEMTRGVLAQNELQELEAEKEQRRKQGQLTPGDEEMYNIRAKRIRESLPNEQQLISGIRYGRAGMVEDALLPSPLTDRRVTMDEYAARRGIMGQEAFDIRAGLVGMAGTRGADKSLFTDIVNLKSMGFAGAQSAMGAVYGTDLSGDPRKALDAVRDIWIELLAKGYDESKAGRMAEQIAGMAGAVGIGGESAIRTARLATAASETLGNLTEQGLSFRQGVLGQFARGSDLITGGGGLMGFGALRGTEKFLGGEEFKDLTEKQRSDLLMVLGSGEQTGKSIQQAMKDITGRDVSEERAKQLADELAKAKVGGLSETMGGITGMQSFQALFYRSMGLVPNQEQGIEAAKTFEATAKSTLGTTQEQADRAKALKEQSKVGVSAEGTPGGDITKITAEKDAKMVGEGLGATVTQGTENLKKALDGLVVAINRAASSINSAKPGGFATPKGR